MKKFAITGVMLICGLTGLIFSPEAGFAQENATLRVMVLSGNDGAPLPGATVLLFDASDGVSEGESFVEGGSTDSDGFLESPFVVPGKYLLRITFIGFETWEDTLTVQAGERQVVNATLEPALLDAGQVVVEAERVFTVGEAGLTRITDVDIARVPNPAPGGDLAGYIQTIPGIISTGDRGGNFHIRGGSPYQNDIRIDNIPVIKPFHISNLFSAIPGELVQSADLYAGGFGAEYIGASSAVIDINLRPGNYREFRGALSAGSNIVSMRMEGPLQVDKHSLLVNARKSLIRNTAPYLIGEEQPIDFHDVVARYSYKGTYVNCGVTGLQTFDRGQINPERQVDFSWSNIAIGGRCMSYDPIFAKPIEFSIGFSYYRNKERSPLRTELESITRKSYFMVDHFFEAWDHIFDYGFGLTFIRGDGILAERFSLREDIYDETSIFKTYFSTDLELGADVTLQPGLAIQSPLHFSPVLDPRVRMSWLPDGTRDHIVSFAAGRYSQLPNALSDTRDAGNMFTFIELPDFGDPLQSSWHGILGYRIRLGSDFEANVEGYVKRYGNIRVPKWNADVQLELEMARAHGLARGFDARLKFDRGPFYAHLNYGWAVLEYRAATEDLGAWVEGTLFRYHPAHDQRHKLSTLFSYEFGPWNAGVNWELGSGQPYTRVYGFDMQLNVLVDNPVEDPGISRTLFSRPYGGRLIWYHRMDLSLKRSLEFQGADFELNAGMMNVYNRPNIFYFDSNFVERVDQTPRMPYFSVRMFLN